ncbi:hypothetical protein GCM10022226_56410 [Sphaerisporangium flaviroseum]|uniref:Hemerythrin-like domain-containing protein n=1 Tax=Sphaerisporangium flaviroseum TaxID=509199 RepID=A0ABP7IVY4_9ACTN
MNTYAGPNGHLTAFGHQLIEVHNWLRQELARLREDVDSHHDGHAQWPRELRAHCLTFCSAVTRHHTGEDNGAFHALAEQFPELRPVLEELTRDHHVVADMLRGLAKLLDLGPDPQDPQRVLRELDGLAALLESHFFYEEKRIVTALNTLSAPDWNGSPPDFLLSTAEGLDDQAGA